MDDDEEDDDDHDHDGGYGDGGDGHGNGAPTWFFTINRGQSLVTRCCFRQQGFKNCGPLRRCDSDQVAVLRALGKLP